MAHHARHPRHALVSRALFAITALLISAMAWADTDYGNLIDAAGRQRMLSQRIVKTYCQIGLGVTPELSRSQLTAAVRRFDTQLAQLSKNAPNAEVRRALADEAAVWKPFRRIALGPVRANTARELAERDRELLVAAHEVVLQLEAAAGTPQARLVNIAGRQRMLSQRLAKLYMLRAYGAQSSTLDDEIALAGREFSTALETLRAAPENTPAIALELEAVAHQWEWFKGALSMQGAQSYAHVVASASEAILNSMELVTGKYAELVKH